MERLNKEIARRSDVVGIFPNDESFLRLASALLIEQNDEWLVGRRCLSAESLAGLYSPEAAGESIELATSTSRRSREVLLLPS